MQVLLQLMQLRFEASQLLFDFWAELLADSCPQLAAHFDEVGIVPQTCLVEWLSTLF